MFNNITHWNLPNFLTHTQHAEFLIIAKNLIEDHWTPYLTSSGRPDGFSYYDLKTTFAGKSVYLLKMNPGDRIDWHTDSKKRVTALTYPLSEQYAPCEFKNGEKTSKPAFLNTTHEHAVFNNAQTRYSLNISFTENMNDSIAIFERLREKYEFKAS
jgi:hypothetical protein